MYLSCSGLVMVQSEYPTIQDAMQKMRELGFQALDLDVFENWQHVNPSRLAAGDPSWVAAFKAALGKMGMKVSSFNCGLSRSLLDPEPEALETIQRELERLMALAEEVGCPNLTLQPGGRPQGQTDKSMRETLLIRLARLGEMTRGRPVTLSFENHANTVVEKPEVALELVRSLWPAVGITYDPSHVAMQGIPLSQSEALLDFTYHVHVRNASPGKMQDTMEAGTVDFEWLIPALERHGYEGGLAIEYFNGFDADFRNTRALCDVLIRLGVSATPPR